MDNIVLTEKGLALRDKLNAGQTTATFTRFCTSSAEYDQSELGVLTELKDSKLESTVTNLEIREDHTMVISGAVDNKSLEEGYYITLIGLYAKETDGEEILFAVSKVSSPMYMPEKSGALSGMSIRFSVKIENSDSINVTVDPTTAATLGDLNALRSEVTTPTFEDYESEESPALPALEDAMKQIKSGNTMRVILQNTKAAFKGLLNLVNAKVNQKDYDAAVSKLNGDISALSGKMTSFESTKSDFVSSSLGQSLGLTTDSLWSAIVTAIKNVVTFLSGSQSVTTSGKWGMSTKNGFWLYIPNNGYYKTDHQLNIPWDTIKDSLGYAAPEDVYIGKTFSSREGVKLTGTMPGFKAGDSAAVTDSKMWGIGTTSGVWMYIPKDGWYSNKYWLQVPWGTLKNFLGNADVSRVLSGYTFTSQNGIKLTGTYKYGVQVTSMTVTSDASTTLFYEGDGTTTVNYNWFYIPLSSIGNHMLCGLRYNKHGVSSGGWEYAVVNPGMIVSLINTGYFIDLTKNQTDVKTSSKPWFPCWEPNTKYDVTVYYVNM